jgi:dinuclear metal center YbgI/SA1388 family protein
MITIENVIRELEKIAPLAYQESYDNCGLLIGSASCTLTGILLCLDSTEEVVDEAIAMNCNLIVAHHPIIFSGLKKITGKNYIERTIIKAIKNDIAIYAIHTNLDAVSIGVNKKLCEVLGLTKACILQPRKNAIKKLITFSPVAHAEKVRQALFDAGSGNIANYSECSFNSTGTGTFKAGSDAQPFAGKKGDRHEEVEIKIEVIFEAHHEGRLVDALLNAHPYEEVAYDILTLDNSLQTVGSGMIGNLAIERSASDFLADVKKQLGTSVLRHTLLPEKKIRRVAVCGGAGIFLLGKAIASGADAFVTSDVKYHEFFDSENKILLVDAGHYETEQFTIQLLYDLLIKIFPTFAIRLTKVITNPVNYY